MAKAEELKNYYRIPADTRDLNYNKFFTEGESRIFKAEEYTSHNTKQLSLKETKDLLLKLPAIREDVLGEEEEKSFAT
jgi:UDP-glucose 4-epimerase